MRSGSAAIAAELGRMDPAGNKQAVYAGTGGACDVGAQAVADRQDAALVGDPEQAEAADRRPTGAGFACHRTQPPRC